MFANKLKVLAAAGLLSSAVVGVSLSSTTASAATSCDTATSAAACGGVGSLIAAAKKEGKLNVITLPSNWANYGKIISDFSKKYGIKVISENPDGSSPDEINAVERTRAARRRRTFSMSARVSPRTTSALRALQGRHVE